MSNVYKQFIVLLGAFLCASALMAAQLPAPQIASEQEPLAPTTLVVQTVTAPLLEGFLLLNHRAGKSADHFNYAFAGPYENDRGLAGLGNLSQMREVKTLFSTESSVPLVNLWGGRLRVAGFTSTLNMQNVQLGPSAAGGLQDFRPFRPNHPGEPGSLDFYGLSLGFHFGRDAQIGRPIQAWRSLPRIFGAVLN